jgi:plasmid stabilization system protein ParE
MSGYAFHPEARRDLDEIWEYIQANNLSAADRVINEILSSVRALVPFPIKATFAPTSLLARCVSSSSANTSSPTYQTRNLFGLWPFCTDAVVHV